MNGRIYDPMLGRMLSADVVVQFPGSLQSYNRYSYVQNNPLKYTDPSGFTLYEKVWGFVAGIAEANGIGGNFSYKQGEAADVTKGRVAGNAVALLQGMAEMDGGGTATVGGTGVTILSGGTLAEVGVPVAVGGALVAAHGAAVSANAVNHMKSNMARVKQNEVKTGSDGGKVDPKNSPVSKEKPGVKPYEVGTKGELDSKAKPGDGLTHDHQPSNASNLARAEKELGRPLTPAEAKQIERDGTAVARPNADHQTNSPTFGGRNNPSKIAADAADPVAAAERDSSSMVNSASEAERAAAQRAADEIVKRAREKQ
ncbi:RHS repeat domain-containing protein [Nibricoccus sp. IMCC34717]